MPIMRRLFTKKEDTKQDEDTSYYKEDTTQDEDTSHNEENTKQDEESSTRGRNFIWMKNHQRMMSHLPVRDITKTL